MKRSFCAVATPSYLCWVRALAKSLELSGNQEQLYVLLVAEFVPIDASLPDNLHLVGLDQLNRALPKNICQYFDAFELCNALKPFIIEWIFQQGVEKVIFLDSDLYITGSFESIWSELELKTLLLTPHQLKPPDLALKHINEASIADMGIFNGGFSAWRAGDTANKMLDWMCTRFPVYGFCDRQAGMFVDQKLLPMLLQYFWDEIEVVSNPCLNIAFWNCHERNVEFTNGIYVVDNQPVIFFHMSGFRLDKAHLVCSYLSSRDNESILAAAPWMVQVLQDYSSLLSSCLGSDSKLPRPFAQFNGIKLIPELRRILFNKGDLSYRDPAVLRAIGLAELKKIKRRLLPYKHA